MLGDVLKKRREELGLEVQDIARVTGMPPKQVIALEADNLAYFVGGKPEIERLTKLYAKKLNMPLDAAFSIDAPQQKKPVDIRSTEVSIPAFLVSGQSRESTAVMKPRPTHELKKAET